MLSEFTDGFGSKIATFAETIANIGVVIVTTPFVLFFMLKDGHHFKEFSTNIMPPKFRKDFHDLLEKIECSSWFIHSRTNYRFILYRYTVVYRLFGYRVEI